jgi:hypothetical protein
MKIIANVTLVGRDKDGNKVETPPGVSTDLPDTDAKDLIARGFAVAAGKPSATAPKAPAGKTAAELQAEADAKAAAEAQAEADKPLLEILKGNEDQVTEALADLDLADLRRLAELEAAGKGRKGVSDAIADEIVEAEKAEQGN